MQKTLLALAVFLGACKPDPLASQRELCKELRSRNELRKGLSIDECAKELKQRADLNDPTRKAQELVDRVVRLVQQGRGKPKSEELRDTIEALQQVGRPAVAPALSEMQTSIDPDLRLALARVLVSTCAEDCATGRYDCIVPALLEGTTDDKPADVRRESEKGLMRCTGEQLGDDPAAWRRWWTDKQRQASHTR